MTPPFRVGFGFDVHRLQAGKKFILGGIEVHHEKGPEGHSDADVLIHAICDALLGAAGLRDIGFHFPNTDPQFKNIDSTLLLQRVCGLLKERKFSIGNIDASVILEQPQVNPHVAAMKGKLSKVMNIEENQISIKATSNEKLGYIGREEGVAAYAIALIFLSE